VFKVRIGPAAEKDLEDGVRFYELQEQGLGRVFYDCLMADLGALRIFAGLHVKPLEGFHRTISKRFPFAIYYDLHPDEVQVHAVLDCRRRPSWIRNRLKRA